MNLEGMNACREESISRSVDQSINQSISQSVSRKFLNTIIIIAKTVIVPHVPILVKFSPAPSYLRSFESA